MLAQRDLRIIILLEEINRLNEKERAILEQLGGAIGGSRSSISSREELILLRK